MPSEELIDIEALRVGMHIHLDLGWMRHPFPLSSFRISSEDQLQVLRTLGLRQLRWSPGLSRLPGPSASADAESEAPDPQLESTDLENAKPGQRIAQARKLALRAQQQALAQCEAQYAEATRVLAEVHADTLRNPARALEQSQMLVSSLLSKMLVEAEVNMRLLTEAAGDRACAHGLNVSLMALLLGKATGLPERDLADLGLGALLHDIGKLELEPRLRFRVEHFTQAEVSGYQWHVAKGVEIGQKMGLSAAALAVIAQHHEQADGSGFPQKLPGDRTHPLARVVALINRFDGLCNPPPNGKVLTPHEALSLMFAQGRSRFDANLLNAFIRMMGVYPPGSTVQLTDERFALVVSVNATRPLKPSVLVHEPGIPSNEALILKLEDSPSLGIRRSLRPADLPDGSREYLRPRQRVAFFPLADSASTAEAF
jgi:putative nucleotidyltransferase with HDIG domain